MDNCPCCKRPIIGYDPSESRDERFWSKVDRSGGPDACWPWTASVLTKRGGYGQFRLNGRTWKAHRVAYELTHGALPSADVFVLHSCDNPRCCNPAHLRAGSAKENAADMMERGRAVLPRLRGERHYQCKLSDADVAAIRSSDAPAKELAARYGVSPNYVRTLRSTASQPRRISAQAAGPHS